MDYAKLIKDAFHLTWKNKFLWIFGLFSGGATISWNGFNYQFDNQDTQEAFSFGQFNQIKSWFYQHELAIGIILISIGLIFILLGIFSIVSQGSIIGGVAKVFQGEKMSFAATFSIGWHHFWRVFGLGILIMLILLAILTILALPIVILAITKLTILAIILGIILGLSYLLFILLSSLIFTYAYRFLIIEQTKIIASIGLAYRFFIKHWKPILIVWLINLGLGIGWAIAVVLAVLLAGGILAAIGVGLYFIAKIVMIVYAVVVGLAFLIALLCLAAGFNTFISSIWTLSYLKLKK